MARRKVAAEARPRTATDSHRPAPARPLRPEELRWECKPLPRSKNPPRASRLLGQDRALAALRVGLDLYGPGYNLFVSGLMGSGRSQVVGHVLEELEPACRLTPDRAYVQNFTEPNRPRLLTLPRGKGPEFRDALEELGRGIVDAVRTALKTRNHKNARRLVQRAAESREQRLMDVLARQAHKEGFTLMQLPGEDGGTVSDLYPMVRGETTSIEQLYNMVGEGRLTVRERDRLLSRRDELLERLEEVTERVRQILRRVDRELAAMDRKVADRVLEAHFRDFARQWPQHEVRVFLDEVRNHLVRILEEWLLEPEAAEGPGPEPAPNQPGPAPAANPQPQPPAAAQDSLLPELAVHVVKTSADDSCPVVVEANPTYTNLFGSIEPGRDGQRPGIASIHPGAILRADGGYLILNVPDLLGEPGVWVQIKRALKFGRLEVREFDPSAGTTAGTLQPEAIPIDVKVVLIGEPGMYERLAEEDPQFLETFKVHAEFEQTVPASAANLRRYADFLGWLAQSEGLRPFEADAAAAVAEFGARRAGRRDRLSTRFGELSDLAREASYLCAAEGDGEVQRRHVEAALQARERRMDLVRVEEERDFAEGYVLLRMHGTAVGQINALMVVSTSTFSYGRPCRVTASTGAGSLSRSGLLNIEREAMLSGPLHDKGVLILEGYLLDRFAQEHPICLQATLCMEQMYTGMDGDSASGAELCALLSSLAQVPIDQSLAMTGSVNQKGEVQAVGGINEKVEGYFRLCVRNGLDGRHGVILPEANVPDLMLDREIVAAVREGRFRMYAVGHVDQAIELLTGLPVGEVHARAARTLERFARHAQNGEA
ncbi:MAG: AAA family ATPase [Planctomycetes bacterium]|nr:AAA family ATPase [Planctomycetota bacterium]